MTKKAKKNLAVMLPEDLEKYQDLAGYLTRDYIYYSILGRKIVEEKGCVLVRSGDMNVRVSKDDAKRHYKNENAIFYELRYCSDEKNHNERSLENVTLYFFNDKLFEGLAYVRVFNDGARLIGFLTFSGPKEIYIAASSMKYALLLTADSIPKGYLDGKEKESEK